MKYIYLDNSATTPVRQEVIDEMMPFFTNSFGNAGSPHMVGQSSRNAVDNAREVISSYINCAPAEVIFTSGGSESNNLAIKGVSFYEKNKAIVSSNIEHSSILSPLDFLKSQGYKVIYINADNTGHIDETKVESALSENSVSILTLSYANSELGTIFNIEKIGEICSKYNVIFHVDALQAVKYLPIDVKSMNIDLLSIGAHKINGPKGVGMLYIKKGTKVLPLIHGGSQEYNLRSGTENTAGIVGFGKAVEILKKERDERYEKVLKLRGFLEKSILDDVKDCRVNGTEPRLPNITNITFKGVPADSLIYRLDSFGIEVSAGTACTSGSLKPSEILLGIGLGEEDARCSIRFSVDHTNTLEEMKYVSEKVKENVNKIRSEKQINE